MNLHLYYDDSRGEVILTDHSLVCKYDGDVTGQARGTAAKMFELARREIYAAIGATLHQDRLTFADGTVQFFPRPAPSPVDLAVEALGRLTYMKLTAADYDRLIAALPAPPALEVLG